MGVRPKANRILLVEDNPGDVYLLEKAMQRLGMNYELIHYADGEQALREIARDDGPVPDLILLDLNLPRREGFDVLRFVRSRPRLSGIPVGIFTSSNDAVDRHRVALIGVERYIHKPPALEEFLDQVGRAITGLLGRAPNEAA